VVFNPVYTKDGSLIKSRETCLTYGKDFAIVKRFKSIRLKHDIFKDGKLESKMEYIKYPLSVIIQHETDHLDGRTIFYR
jgi:peptide deformylase